MYCRNCGNAMNAGEKICENCGIPVGYGTDYCLNCGTQTNGATVCSMCGLRSAPDVNINPITDTPEKAVLPNAKSRTLAAVLGIFLGAFGVHSFYLGYKIKGIMQLLVTCWTCGIGGVWGIIEGILILGGKINTDAGGNLLKD